MSWCAIDLLIMKKHRSRNSVRSWLPGSDSSWNTISHIWWSPSSLPMTASNPASASPPGFLEIRLGDPGVFWLQPTNGINERWGDINRAACTALHRAELHWMLNAHFVNRSHLWTHSKRTANPTDAHSHTLRGASLLSSLSPSLLSIYLYLSISSSNTLSCEAQTIHRTLAHPLRCPFCCSSFR